MIGNPFAPLAARVMGGVILALLMALGVVMWRADAISGQRDAARDDLAMETAKHAITRQSLDLLESKLAAMIEAGKVSRQNVEKAVSEAKEQSDDLRSQADDVRAQTGSDCVTPDAVRNADL